MTFCLGISVDEGLVGIADTRLVSGNEALTNRKVATYQGPGFCFFLMTSGLRSLRDKVLLYFEEAFAKDPDARTRLYKVVNLLSRQVRRVAEEDAIALKASELRFNLHCLLGGQMSNDSEHRLFLVYPEANWVEVGPDTPYQIIGASGYGKPILERSVNRKDSLLYAFKVGILAFDATRLCAVDVGFPIDVILCTRNSRKLHEHRYQGPELQDISRWWQEKMRSSVLELPSEWIERAFSALLTENHRKT
jgi:putative proteasome-type protease